MSKIRVVLVEDHDLTRVGLKTALQQYSQLEIVGDAADGQRGLALLQHLNPDVAIVDIGLPDMDGIEVTRRFKAQQTAGDESLHDGQGGTKVLILTMHDSEDSVLAAFAAGADSYSVKDVKLDKLVEAIEATHQGNAWIDPAIARIVLQETQKPRPDLESDRQTTIDAVSPQYEELIDADPLTNRELEVLELIVAGHNNAAIADALQISIGTVKTHVRNILSKLCASDRTQAAVRALRSGLVS
ncbi:MAG: response regulator transcription factor [Synechococcales cyanobacterium K44_A2020_017]|uniref:response regulator n=1 Tax=Leptolyngbya sp. CCY15150 TaxID=2767772 RepID=UPI00194FBE5A|nr:response regulator transcription factor [Leptolyngbya sp. CCY15150]MBF2088390.1 response regulator transcription factor [Synechococcales cyanobacterium K32_A2020_035]MBF2093437.1 response regulator transcription factor [Synechococcales cyanobacterium K44_A2020_017]